MSLRNHCYAFRASNKNIFQQQLFKIDEMWNILKRRSERTNLPIPHDLIKPNDLMQKLNNLEESIKIKSENLENEENKVKQLYKEIEKVNDYKEALEKFNELKEQYDMDHWNEFKKNTFVYILGEKLQNYVKSLNESIVKYEELYKTFNEINTSINNEIQNFSEDLFGIQNSISKLDGLLKNIKDRIEIIQKIDPSIQFCENEFQSKIETDKRKFEDYIKNSINAIIENEINSIYCILKKIQNEMENHFSKYENKYSTDLCSKFTNEYIMELPKCDRLKQLFTLTSNESECQRKLIKINETLNDIKQKYDEKFKVLNDRQNDCLAAEEILNDIKNKCSYINSYSLQYIFDSYNKIQKLIQAAESHKKNWNDNAEGKTIDLNNTNMENANERMKEIPDEIIFKFEYDFNKYIKNIDDIQIQNDSYIIYNYNNNCYNMEKIKNYLSEIDLFISINDMFILNRNNEIDEIKTKINEKMNLFQQEIDSHPKKLSEYINELLHYFVELQFEDKKKLISEKSPYLENELKKILSQKFKFDEYFDAIIDHITEHKLNVDTTEITKVKETFYYLYAFYKSTLLLKPTENLEKLKNLPLQTEIICACSLYVDIFKQKKYDYDINEEDLTKIERFIHLVFEPYSPFGIILLNEFQNIVTKELNKEQLFYAELLSESIVCLSEFNILNNMKGLQIILKNEDQYDNIMNQINENYELTKNSHLKDLINKLKIVIKEKYEKFGIIGSNLFMIDFGSYEKKYMYVDKNGYCTHKTYYPIISFEDRHKGQDKKSEEDILRDILNYSKNRSECFCIVYVHDKMDKRFYFIEDIVKEYHFRSYNIIDSSIGIVYNGNNDSGIAVDLGDKCLTITPVFHKYELNCGIIYRHCGNDIALIFQNSLKPSSCEEMNHIKQSNEINKIIESFMRNNTRVRSERNEEIPKYVNIANHFITSEGSIEAPEKVLFNDDFNLSKQIIKVAEDASKATKYDINIFLSNIFLAGNVAKTKGLVKKLTKDIKEKYNSANIISENLEYGPIDGVYTLISALN